MPPASRAPRCLFCEKPIRPLEPIMMTMLAPEPGQTAINVPLHLVCFIDTTAGRTARATVDALHSDGRINIGLDGDDGLPLADLVSGIVARLIRRG